MIPCARLYVDPTLALMSQAMEKRIPGLLKQQLENTRGQNSLFIMITSKDNMQPFKKA